MDSNIAIKIDKVSKIFKLPHEKQLSVKGALINFRNHRTYEKQQALKDVSFEVKKGEFFGIVGRNGSGKSTLLKLIAGIYTPTEGQITINGSLTPFIELGVGFNPELTGRENVFLNGSLLGFNRKQMRAKYKDIVEFAELEKFMDQKLKNYSSGMQVRLAFSIAIRAEADTLLLDEVLAVGDGAFQQKCYDYFYSLKQNKQTVILVSHNMNIINQFCERALLLEQSGIKKIGSSSEISNMYEEMFIKEEAERIKITRGKTAPKFSNNQDPIKIHSIKVMQAGKAVDEVKAKHDFEVAISLESQEDFNNLNVGFNINNRDKQTIIFSDTYVHIGNISLEKNHTKKIIFKIDNILTNGLYSINIGIADTKEVAHRVIMRKDNVCDFRVIGIKNHAKALAHPSIVVEVK